MTVELIIGESKYNRELERYQIDIIEDLLAPIFKNDSLTGSTNFRSMAFHNCQETMKVTQDLWALMYGSVGYELSHRKNLMFPSYLDSRETGSVAQILPEDLEIVEKAIETRLLQSPLPPGFGSDDKDPVHARLIWLKYWMKRSLKLDINPSIKCY